jgi:replication-associated recombination protein RarA
MMRTPSSEEIGLRQTPKLAMAMQAMETMEAVLVVEAAPPLDVDTPT